MTSQNLRQLRVIAQARRDLPPPEECRRIRTEAGISLRRLAAAVGVSKAAVHTWENGARRPSGESAVKYERALRAIRGDAA